MVFDRAELEVFRDEDFGAVEPLDPSHLAHVQAPVVPSELAPELRESIQRRAQGSAAERLMAHGLLARSWTPATGGALAALSAFLDGGEHPADELLTIGRQQVSAEPALWKTTTIHLAEATTAALRHAEWLDAEGLAWTLSARDDLESLAILGPEEDWVREIRRHVDQVARTASSAFGTMPLQPEAHLATLVWQAPDAWWLRCADQHAELPRGGTASKLGPQVRR